MFDLDSLFNLNVISWQDALLRLFLACIFCFAIGFDRESKNKPIDIRAYMIVGVSSCLLAMVGQEFYTQFRNYDDPSILQLDLGKVISGTLTGIGFLGAGAIFRRDDNYVVGTATGASIWASGGIGLALGFGFYGLATVTTLLILAVLVVLGKFHYPLE